MRCLLAVSALVLMLASVDAQAAEVQRLHYKLDFIEIELATLEELELKSKDPHVVVLSDIQHFFILTGTCDCDGNVMQRDTNTYGRYQTLSLGYLGVKNAKHRKEYQEHSMRRCLSPVDLKIMPRISGDNEVTLSLAIKAAGNEFHGVTPAIESGKAVLVVVNKKTDKLIYAVMISPRIICIEQDANSRQSFH
ncbi:MAG: hypothetical protein NXI22_26130 [bacterium]|nr:hypothetical protein [bacterium]